MNTTLSYQNTPYHESDTNWITIKALGRLVKELVCMNEVLLCGARVLLGGTDHSWPERWKLSRYREADIPVSDRFADWENAQSARTINLMSHELLTNQAPIAICNSKFDRVNARMRNTVNTCTRNNNRKSEDLLLRARRKHCEKTPLPVKRNWKNYTFNQGNGARWSPVVTTICLGPAFQEQDKSHLLRQTE